MITEKSFLQNVKLEISRNVKLEPYERMAFHKILGFLKSDIGLSILLNELDKSNEVRASAISTIIKFENPDIVTRLMPYLKKNISAAEKIGILTYIEKHGGEYSIPDLIDFIEIEKEKTGGQEVVSKAFVVLRSIGGTSDLVLDFLLKIINDRNSPTEIISYAIFTLSVFKGISTFEELAKREDNFINYAIFRSLYCLSCDLIEASVQNAGDEERLFTYTPDSEDKVVLDIRVFLGKMSARFETYSNQTKVAFISAMMSSNHREYQIYIMKALTSKDYELITMTLYAIFENINRLRDPDKLFRSLIALSTESDRDNDLIIDIFSNFFKTRRKSRQFNILQDKLYSYIVVTLETYFETFRKEFMITDVIEKGYPESFQRVRKFILKRFTPDIKKEILNYLTSETPATIKQIIADLSRWVTHIDDNEKDDLHGFYEILFDADAKSRINSAARFDDINFEKKYLKNRIIRLCMIIGELGIHDGASALVNIYNYLKKYPDPAIMDATIHTLSILNYSYMLGEIEILLSAGSEDEQRKGLGLLSLFYEQRSLNIIIEYLQKHSAQDSDLLIIAINILFERDIFGNVTAQKILKGIIESNNKPEIRSRAILALGKCGFDSDIFFLNGLFSTLQKDDPKDVIVLSIGYIISLNKSYKKRDVIKCLQEYLKDPGINVRIYSCLLLASLGYAEAAKLIRDMLIIKNKNIQRILMLVLGELRSIEYCFFFISLLNEEYGIQRDIIPLIEMLPEPDLREIDAFIVNIFQKFEAPDPGDSDKQKSEVSSVVKGLEETEITVLKIDIYSLLDKNEGSSIPDVVHLNLNIRSHIASSIVNSKGIIVRMSNKEIMAFFLDPVSAGNTALQISKNMDLFNKSRTIEKNISIYIQLVTAPSKVINEELIAFPEYIFRNPEKLPLKNRIMFNENFIKKSGGVFAYKVIPEIVFHDSGMFMKNFELLNYINFSSISNDIIRIIDTEDDKKLEIQLQVAEELKRIKRENRSASAATIARELDEIGNQIKKQLNDIERYVQRRSTDRELNNNVRKMLNNVYNYYKVEISRIIIE